jgi:hypothetical protein
MINVMNAPYYGHLFQSPHNLSYNICSSSIILRCQHW